MELPRAAAKGTAPQPKMVKQLKNGPNHAKREYTWLPFIVRGTVELNETEGIKKRIEHRVQSAFNLSCYLVVHYLAHAECYHSNCGIAF